MLPCLWHCSVLCAAGVVDDVRFSSDTTIAALLHGCALTNTLLSGIGCILSQTMAGARTRVLLWVKSAMHHWLFGLLFDWLQEYGEIIDVEIIFNERGSKVCGVMFLISAIFSTEIKCSLVPYLQVTVKWMLQPIDMFYFFTCRCSS